MPAIAAASTEQPYLAIVAPPENQDSAQCVTGTVLVDQHQQDMRTLHSQLQNLTIVEGPECRLRVVGRIADGTWSSVYHVCEENYGRSYALKVIPIEGVNVHSSFARIATLKKLRHPNIVKYYNHFTHVYGGVNCLCVQIEYCGSGTLASYIWAKAHQKLGISASRIQDFAIQMMSALSYVHEQGFLHGDLRPGNVLIMRERKQLKLTSFGSPLWLERGGHTPRSITGGCKTYAPPEWMDSEVPHRNLQQWEKPLPSYDMWSFGCVLSELVTLKLIRNDRQLWGTPLAADTPALQAITREVTTSHGGTFAELFGRLMDPNPETRIDAGEALRILRSLQPHTILPLSGLRMSFSRVLISPRA
eukprot:GGOE01046659.1.p1 GENE.GGOE01046659.1~~GGOE01046659.1.p1  ORF type:complete len:372 (-),score=100.04 GGOE01046659.1:215-1297(-)